MSHKAIEEMCANAEFFFDPELNGPNVQVGKKQYYSPNKGGLYKNKPLKKCEWPSGCDQQTKTQFCKQHMQLISSRKSRGVTDWNKLYADPDIRYANAGRPKRDKQNDTMPKDTVSDQTTSEQGDKIQNSLAQGN